MSADIVLRDPTFGALPATRREFDAQFARELPHRRRSVRWRTGILRQQRTSAISIAKAVDAGEVEGAGRGRLPASPRCGRR